MRWGGGEGGRQRDDLSVHSLTSASPLPSLPQCLAFSDDELLLCTVGVVDDNKILIWDLSNGYIVTMVNHNPKPCTCVTWGGMIKDIKRRDTANYQVGAAAREGVCWGGECLGSPGGKDVEGLHHPPPPLPPPPALHVGQPANRAVEPRPADGRDGG